MSLVILIIITFLIDFLLGYYLPNNFYNINIFYPMLLIVLIVYLFPRVDSKKYFKIVFFIGFIYDLFYSYIFLLNALLFLIMAKTLKKIDKYLRCNILIYVLFIIIFISFYDLILFLLVYFSKINVVSLADLGYKISHSLIINIGYYFLLLIVLKNVKFKKN